MKPTKEQIRNKVNQARIQKAQQKKELMKLTKAQIIDLYLNLRAEKVFLEIYTKPVLDRGLHYEKQLTDNQEKAAEQKRKNGQNKFDIIISLHNIKITPTTTAGQIEKTLLEKGATEIPDLKTIRGYLKIKKGVGVKLPKAS